ncbi:hypothetical protein Gotur_034434 [Gossypium turneri]
MHAGERERVDSLDVRSSYLHGSTVTFGRLIKFQEDIECRAPWLLPDEIIYRCGDFDWVPLLRIWGAVGYAPLLVLRQYRSRQFVPTHRMKRLVVGPMITPEYSKWWVKRINDNVPRPSQENSQSIGEHLRVIPSELEIIK